MPRQGPNGRPEDVEGNNISSQITLDLLRGADTESFPVIDLGDFVRGAPGALNNVARQLRYALENIGFLIVVNHGVDSALIDGLVEQARRFHALPLAEKIKLETGSGTRSGFTGYLPSGKYVIKTSEFNDNNKPDLNAAFFMDRERSPDDPEVRAGKLFRAADKWPENLPGFRETLLRYWDALEGFSRRLLPAFAVALELPPEFFDSAFADAQCVLRLSHFPAVAYQDNQFGLAPHTDANFFTVLPQSNVEGLYIRPHGRGWLKAPRIPGSFIINSGDVSKRWTNDRFLSTAHLAVNLTDQDRYSTPFFYTPHIDYPITCLPTCCSAANPARYPPITYGEYRVWWLNNNYRTKLEA
jgi:isopenicillin N synthase-like dioxygenase